MPVETSAELAQKIARQEELLAKLEADDRPNEQAIANTELEIARLKNLKGDEGLNRAIDIDFPEETIDQTTAVNTPDHKNVKKQILSGSKDVTQEIDGNTNFNQQGKEEAPAPDPEPEE